MRGKVLFLILISVVECCNQFTSGQNGYPPVIDCDKEVVYKTIDSIQLKLWLFYPPSNRQDSKSPSIIFFFGGGWNSGNPKQFSKHCEYLAARGMVAMVADYRVASRHGVLASDCVSDAKSAVRWLRQNALDLGLDPGRIAAGGGSAGGHLAAATAILPGFDEPGDDLSISSAPDALVLFNPGVILAPVPGILEDEVFHEMFEKIKPRLGAEPESMSPYHHVIHGLPPAIIFHGTADELVPYETVRSFTGKMIEYGNNCTLVGYRDEGHGFFNYGRGNNGSFISTVYRMDNFLVSLGYLAPPPEVILDGD